MEWTSVIIAFVLIGCSYGDIHHLKKQLDISDLTRLELDLEEYNDFSALFKDISVEDDLPKQEDAERRLQDAKRQLKDYERHLNESDIQLKERCLKNADLQAYERAKTAMKTYDSCFTTLVNVMELTQEIEREQLTGNLAQVFKKHCKKSQNLLRCVRARGYAIEPCLDEKDKEVHHIAQYMEESLIQFICQEQGLHTTHFFAESDLHCYQDNQHKMHDCLMGFMGVDNSNSTPGDQMLCTKFRTYQKCIVTVVKTCNKKPAPVQLAEGLFNVIYESTTCEWIMVKALYGDREESANGGNGIYASLTLFVSLLSLLAVKLV